MVVQVVGKSITQPILFTVLFLRFSNQSLLGASEQGQVPRLCQTSGRVSPCMYYVCMYVCVYVCMYVCMYVCVCMCVCIHPPPGNLMLS